MLDFQGHVRRRCQWKIPPPRGFAALRIVKPLLVCCADAETVIILFANHYTPFNKICNFKGHFLSSRSCHSTTSRVMNVQFLVLYSQFTSKKSHRLAPRSCDEKKLCLIECAGVFLCPINHRRVNELNKHYTQSFSSRNFDTF